MEKKRKKINYLIEFGLILFIALFVGFLFWNAMRIDKKEEADGNTGKEPSQSEIDIVEYEGKKYSYNHNLTNILFMGTDKEKMSDRPEVSGEAGQADVLLLLSLNKETKEAVIYQIPRETMTEIDVYDNNGNRIDSQFTQIAYQYAHSIGGKSSCWAVQKTVTELLHNVNIDGYIAMDIAAIPTLNDAIGGVTLTISEDYTMLDPALVKDSLVTLNGKQAQDYIRYLDKEQTFNNQQRMERQFQFITAWMDGMKNLEEEEFENLYPLLEQHVITTMSEDEIKELIQFDYSDAESKFIPGEWMSGDTADEYHVDEELKKMVMEDFYIQK